MILESGGFLYPAAFVLQNILEVFLPLPQNFAKDNPLIVKIFDDGNKDAIPDLELAVIQHTGVIA